MQDDTQQPAATYPPSHSLSLSLSSSLFLCLSLSVSLLMLSLNCLQIQFPLILIFVSRSLRSFEYCMNEDRSKGSRQGGGCGQLSGLIWQMAALAGKAFCSTNGPAIIQCLFLFHLATFQMQVALSLSVYILLALKRGILNVCKFQV